MKLAGCDAGICDASAKMADQTRRIVRQSVTKGKGKMKSITVPLPEEHWTPWTYTVRRSSNYGTEGAKLNTLGVFVKGIPHLMHTVLHKEEIFLCFLLIFCDILCLVALVRHVIIVHLSLQRNTLAQVCTYLQHDHRMRRKFSSVRMKFSFKN